MCEMHTVQLKVWENGDIFIPIGCGLKFLIFQMWSKLHGHLSIHFDQHELVGKVFLKIRKVGDVGCDFCEVADGSWLICSQVVGFDKDAFLLDPHKKMIGGTAVLDAAKGAVAEEVAANANVHFVLIFEACH